MLSPRVVNLVNNLAYAFQNLIWALDLCSNYNLFGRPPGGSFWYQMIFDHLFIFCFGGHLVVVIQTLKQQIELSDPFVIRGYRPPIRLLAGFVL